MTMDQHKTVYERQLSTIKEIIPTLSSSCLVEVCSAWIERFTTCRQEEELHRTKLVNLFVKHLRRDGKLGKPFIETNLRIPFKDIIIDHFQEFESIKPNNRSNISIANVREISVVETQIEPDSACTKNTDEKYLLLCKSVTKMLTRFESHLSQIKQSDNPQKQMQKIKFNEFNDMYSCPTGLDLSQIFNQIQKHWTDIYKPAESDPTNTRKSRSSKIKLGRSHHSLWTSSDSEPDTISTGSLLSRIKSNGTQSSLSLDMPDTVLPSKYKRFVLKCARRMEKMQQQIATLKRDSEIRKSTESIRYAALKSELVERAGAKQQAEMCAMIDQLDERYREIITKTMSLSLEPQRQG